jgi:hypothetical protein
MWHPSQAHRLCPSYYQSGDHHLDSTLTAYRDSFKLFWSFILTTDTRTTLSEDNSMRKSAMKENW